EKKVRPARSLLGPGRLARLIADLDARKFAVREQATRELERVAPLVEAPLRRALASNPSPEARRRLEAILEKAGGWVPTPEEVRGMRAAEVLERIGTEGARRLLEKLANGAEEVGVTQEAKAALRRLGAAKDRR